LQKVLKNFDNHFGQKMRNMEEKFRKKFYAKNLEEYTWCVLVQKVGF